jgi:hypothetical protein
MHSFHFVVQTNIYDLLSITQRVPPGVCFFPSPLSLPLPPSPNTNNFSSYYAVDFRSRSLMLRYRILFCFDFQSDKIQVNRKAIMRKQHNLFYFN